MPVVKIIWKSRNQALNNRQKLKRKTIDYSECLPSFLPVKYVQIIPLVLYLHITTFFCSPSLP